MVTIVPEWPSWKPVDAIEVTAGHFITAGKFCAALTAVIDIKSQACVL